MLTNSVLKNTLLVEQQPKAVFAHRRPQVESLAQVTTGVIQNHTDSFALLQTIRELGIPISIDDFGTGYSSMHRFRDLPADEIKLDRSFIHNIVEDEANQKITHTLIELCHRFEKIVVAEGIEDGATVEYLNDAGCDLGQGFYLGAPMGKDRFRLLLN